MRAARAATAVLVATAALPGLLSARAFELLASLRAHGIAGSETREVAVAGLLLAGAALALLAATRLRPERRLNAALAAASTVAALYAAEVALAFTDPAPRNLRERLALVDSLADRQACGAVPPVHFVLRRDASLPVVLHTKAGDTLPLAGPSRRLTVDCRERRSAGWLTYQTDEHGFLNPPGLWDQGPVELAALGDSFTAGSCVPPERGMIGLLRERVPSTVNLGLPGNGPLLMLGHVREYLPALRPKRVLWCHFGGNDLRDLRLELRHPVASRYLQPGFSQGLLGRQAELDEALVAYERDALRPALWRAARNLPAPPDLLPLRRLRLRAGLIFTDPETFVPTEAEMATFAQVLARARTEVQAWGGELYFVYLEGWRADRLNVGERALTGLDERMRVRVLEIARAEGLPIVNVEDAFARSPDRAALFACPGCHYNEAGYALASQVLSRALEPRS